MPGSGTVAPPPKLEAGLPKPAALPPPSSPVREPLAAPLVKMTVAPAPMVSELSVWLTVPKRSLVPLPASVTVTTAKPGAVPRVPFTLAVPSFTFRMS